MPKVPQAEPPGVVNVGYWKKQTAHEEETELEDIDVIAMSAED